MWPLFIIGLIGFVIAIERMLYLHKEQIRTGEFISGIKNLLRKRRLVEALTVCEETPGPVSNVIKAALLNYNQEEPKMLADIQIAALVEIPNLERRIGTIATIAKISPLIGIMGTIISVYQGFNVLQSEGPYANISMLSGFVSQALLTTAAGLLIAIISYLVHHFLVGRVHALVHDMEWVGHDIMQFLLRDFPEEDPVDSQGE